MQYALAPVNTHNSKGLAHKMQQGRVSLTAEPTLASIHHLHP